MPDKPTAAKPAATPKTPSDLLGAAERALTRSAKAIENGTPETADVGRSLRVMALDVASLRLDEQKRELVAPVAEPAT